MKGGDVIKFGTTNSDGSHMIGIGLSAENIKRLKEGKPILFDLGELGFRLVKARVKKPGKVFIMFGETEDDIAKKVYRERGIPRLRIDSR